MGHLNLTDHKNHLEVLLNSTHHERGPENLNFTIFATKTVILRAEALVITWELVKNADS